MPVITISRQLGSLGTEIAEGAAAKLNYEYLDKKGIEQALANYGVLAPEVKRFDEKKPSFWDSFLFQKKKFLHCLEAAIYDFARKGKVVIVGRGGQVLLKDLPGVLHVRIAAPFAVRVKRIAAAEGGDEKKAGRFLSRSDRDSAGFLRSFFEVDWEDPAFYDLVISTEKLSAETAVKMIVASVSSPELQEGEKASEGKLADLALTQKVEVVLMEVLGIAFRNVTPQVKEGFVNLSGQVASEPLKAEVLRAVSRIEGVKGVAGQFHIMAQYYGP